MQSVSFKSDDLARVVGDDFDRRQTEVGKNLCPDAVVAKVPNATKAVIPSAGHFPHLETPEAFNAAVREFLMAKT